MITFFPLVVYPYQLLFITHSFFLLSHISTKGSLVEPFLHVHLLSVILLDLGNEYLEYVMKKLLFVFGLVLFMGWWKIASL